MAAPWERYQQQAGPWSQYQAPSEAPAPDTPELLGGAGATMGAASPESFWSEAGRKLKEALMGHPDRDESVADQPTTAKMLETAASGGAAMLGGAGMGQIAAAPLRAGMAMAGGYAGEKAGQGVGELAEGAGAPRGTAAVAAGVGAIAGAASPARALRSLAGGRAGAVIEAVNPRAGAALRQVLGGAEAAAPAGAAPAAAAKAAPSAAASQAEEIQAKILSLRKDHGLSGAQITSSLRQLYGIPPNEGQKMVQAVLESALMVKR